MYFFEHTLPSRLSATLYEALISSSRQPRVLDKSTESELRELDPGYDRAQPLSKTTISMLEELYGESAKSIYLLKEPKDYSPDELRSIARAMALSGLDFQSLDRIALRFMEEVFLKVSHSRDYSLHLSKGRKHSLASLNREIITPVASMEEPIEELKLTLRTESEKIGFKLSFDGEGKPRLFKPSMIFGMKARAWDIATELNLVIADFGFRTAILESYRGMKPSAGLDSVAIEAVKRMLRVFHKEPVDCGNLKPGIYFQGSYLDLADDSRGYLSRCRDCGATGAMEVVHIYGRTDYSWLNESDTFRSRIIEEDVNPILIAAHRQSGCEGDTPISGRTGKQMTKEGGSLQWL